MIGLDITFNAIQILASDEAKRRGLNDPELLEQLLQVAIHCEGMTYKLCGRVCILIV